VQGDVYQLAGEFRLGKDCLVDIYLLCYDGILVVQSSSGQNATIQPSFQHLSPHSDPNKALLVLWRCDACALLFETQETQKHGDIANPIPPNCGRASSIQSKFDIMCLLV
jgi:hypothetical protein